MKNVSKITSHEAKEIYDENKKTMRQMIKRNKRLTFYYAILAGIITWQTILGWGRIAYADENSKIDSLGFRAAASRTV